MTTESASAPATSTASAPRSPIRIVAAVLLAILSLVIAGGTIMFALVLPEQKLVGWAVVALVGVAVLLAALPGLVRGTRLSWTVALCWVVACAYWGLYKLFVEGETASLVFNAAEAVILVLLLVPAGRPRT